MRTMIPDNVPVFGGVQDESDDADDDEKAADSETHESRCNTRGKVNE